ncbi:NB-ARC domain-containing disease resistance protein [Melia azedarach]|uniref:NB-ARC domain-containing disease resistance protein n=1 Tax=Melia azedarach TaxID=155640 RepID=A0ACC1Y210_MELAZ|nr:NB-ARC domain-containing disease resistance protein [Melia azedarach]
MTHRNLSKETVNAAEDATNILAKGNFSNVSFRRPAPVKTEYKNIGRGYQKFDFRRKVFQDVMEALTDLAGFLHQNKYGLKLSQIPHLKEIWHDQSLPVSHFNNLTRLVVDGCTFISSDIPTNLLPFLNNLRTLKVRNCGSMEEVFHLEELNANEHLGKLFPKLWGLYLIDLPKLKKFCNFNGNIIELPNLSSLSIENCPNMETFIANSTPVQPLFDSKVILS